MPHRVATGILNPGSFGPFGQRRVPTDVRETRLGEECVVRDRRAIAAVPFGILLLLGGCSKSTPTAPSVSVGQPTPLLPSNGAQIANLAQPVTLVVQNATVSGSTSVFYTFEVATDSGFANKAQGKGGIIGGSGGQTVVTLDTLLANQTYFWHAQATGGGSTGAFGPTYSFSIGPVVSLGTPTLVSPVSNGLVSDRPKFTVTNAVKVGPTGTVVYKFEVSDSLGFTNIVAAGTVSEGPGQTSYTPSLNLPTGKTLYWRVTALDQTNNVTGVPSAVQSFTCNPSSAAGNIATQQGIMLWTGTQPTGTPGQATMGPGWDVGVKRDFYGNSFTSPTLEELRIFDLLDRGMQPDPAIAWMQSNGYPTAAVYYSSVRSIGFFAQYMALIGGSWELVLRVGA